MTAETLTSPTSTAPSGLLSKSEQISLGVRLTLSLIAGGCLILSGALEFLAPNQIDVAELVAGVAAVLVAVPRFRQRGRACAIRICTASPTNSSRWL